MQMKVINRKMYHFLDREMFNDNWLEGREFIVDDNYKSFAYFYHNEPVNIYFDDQNKKEKLFYKIDEALNNKLNKNDMRKLAFYLKAYLNNQEILVREYVLENIRKNEFPNLISREHCLFLSDKKSFDFWNEKFIDTDRLVLELAVTGNLFYSYDCLLPEVDKCLRIQEIQARYYWQSKLEAFTNNNEHNYNDKEYLFQGKVKVLRRI